MRLGEFLPCRANTLLGELVSSCFFNPRDGVERSVKSPEGPFRTGSTFPACGWAGRRTHSEAACDSAPMRQSMFVRFPNSAASKLARTCRDYYCRPGEALGWNPANSQDWEDKTQNHLRKSWV